MTRWQAGYLEANGIRLHYTRTGGDGPPLLLAHGFSDDGLCWTPVAEDLASDYDVIMVDARGHGRSDAPEVGYSSDSHAADLAGVITALGLERPAVLGHSMGAATTLMLAGSYPNLISRILLEDPPMWWLARDPGAAASDEARWAGMRAWALSLKRKTGPELIAEQRAQTPHWSEAELGPWADAKLWMSINVLNRDSPTQMDWSAILRRISVPALLITGDPPLGAIVTEEGAAALKTLVPHLQVAHIAGAGHSVRRDQLDRYLDVVRGFLAG